MSEPVLVGIAQMAVAKAPEKICCMGLGSCVAVFLYDPRAKIGGVVHVLLPKAPRVTKTPLKYADAGVKALFDELVSNGARKENLKAKLVGGAQMFHNLNIGISDIGKDNVEEARKALRQLGIRVSAQDIQGNRGRSAVFDPGSGTVSIKTAFSEEHFI